MIRAVLVIVILLAAAFAVGLMIAGFWGARSNAKRDDWPDNKK